MKKVVLMGSAAVLLIGCSESVPAPGPGNTTASAQTSHAVPDERDQRLSFFCTSLDNSPDVQLSSLEEVWAATNYLRMESCEVSYVGPQPFQPTSEESAVIETANAGGSDSSDDLDAYLTAVRLCTRVSDETAPGGFADSPKEVMRAAAKLCPNGPQGKIIQAWADGTRMGDGKHFVGDGIEPGRFARVKPGVTAEAGDCAWDVADAHGQVLRRASPSGTDAVSLEKGEVFTSDKCGIWGKID